MSTIINLAQNYVGSNNINILSPIGQFGTRLNGGKDAASPRYYSNTYILYKISKPGCKITKWIEIVHMYIIMNVLNCYIVGLQYLYLSHKSTQLFYILSGTYSPGLVLWLGSCSMLMTSPSSITCMTII